MSYSLALHHLGKYWAPDTRLWPAIDAGEFIAKLLSLFLCVST
jgi:hypothetical protein